MRWTTEKEIYCHNCDRWFNYLGIANHRKKHLNNGEEVKITYTDGTTKIHGKNSVHWKPKEQAGGKETI